MIIQAKTLLLVFLSTSTIVLASESSRSETEATSLLRAVFANRRYSNPSDLTSCRVSSAWATEAVPQETAHEVFGINLQADLVATAPVPDSSKVLANVVSIPELLCPPAASRNHDVRMADGRRPFNHTWSVTYPVFNASFTKAIVIFFDMYARDSLSYTSLILILAKHGGKWKLVKSEVLGET